MLSGKLFNFFRSLNGIDHDRGQYYEAAGRLIPFMWSRRLATTERGYVGVVLRVGQREDVVAVLLWCSCPLLLRPRGEKVRDRGGMLSSGSDGGGDHCTG
jgi:hypothetical protein